MNCDLQLAGACAPKLTVDSRRMLRQAESTPNMKAAAHLPSLKPWRGMRRAQVFDFSPVISVFRGFSAISQPQGIGFPPVTRFTGENFSRSFRTGPDAKGAKSERRQRSLDANLPRPARARRVNTNGREARNIRDGSMPSLPDGMPGSRQI